MKNIDINFLRDAYRVAASQSTDPSTQNGAILVKLHEDGTYEVKAEAANHFPENVKNIQERWQKPIKYFFVEHSERNVIFKAARKGEPTDGLIMYACWAACADCARAIIQSGIKEVVTHHNPLDKTRFGQPVSVDWQKSIVIAMQMFEEAGVKVRWLEDKLFPDGELQVLFNGSLIVP